MLTSLLVGSASQKCENHKNPKYDESIYAAYKIEISHPKPINRRFK